MRQDRDTERRRNAELEAARVQAEEAANTLREQAEQLRAERNLLQTEYAHLVTERLDAEREHQAERDRQTAALAPAAEQAAAAVRRGEELDARLATLRQEVEAAWAGPTAEHAPVATDKAVQADLLRQPADAPDERRATVATTEQPETEVRDAGDQAAIQIESPPEPAVPASERSLVSAQSSEDQEQPLDELRRQLRLGRDSIGRFRAILASLGAHRHVTDVEPK